MFEYMIHSSIFMKTIAACSFLGVISWLVLEIGYAQAEAVLALGRAAGWQNAVCRKDHGGNDRVILLQKP